MRVLKAVEREVRTINRTTTEYRPDTEAMRLSGNQLREILESVQEQARELMREMEADHLKLRADSEPAEIWVQFIHEQPVLCITITEDEAASVEKMPDADQDGTTASATKPVSGEKSAASEEASRDER